MEQFKLFVTLQPVFGIMVAVAWGYEIRIYVLCMEICIGLASGAHGYWVFGLTNDKAVKEGEDGRK